MFNNLQHHRVFTMRLRFLILEFLKYIKHNESKNTTDVYLFTQFFVQMLQCMYEKRQGTAQVVYIQLYVLDSLP